MAKERTAEQETISLQSESVMNGISYLRQSSQQHQSMASKTDLIASGQTEAMFMIQIARPNSLVATLICHMSNLEVSSTVKFYDENVIYMDRKVKIAWLPNVAP